MPSSGTFGWRGKPTLVRGNIGLVQGGIGFVHGGMGLVQGGIGFVHGGVGLVQGGIGFVKGGIRLVVMIIRRVPGIFVRTTCASAVRSAIPAVKITTAVFIGVYWFLIN
jgi:hypothetical protein